MTHTHFMHNFTGPSLHARLSAHAHSLHTSNSITA